MVIKGSFHNSMMTQKVKSKICHLLSNLIVLPGPIASDFCQLSEKLGIRRKLILFFSLPLVNFTAENVPFGRC